MSDVSGARFLQKGRSAEEGIDLALNERVHRLDRGIREPAEVLGVIEPDQDSHDGQKRLVSDSIVGHAHGPALQPAVRRALWENMVSIDARR